MHDEERDDGEHRRHPGADAEGCAGVADQPQPQQTVDQRDRITIGQVAHREVLRDLVECVHEDRDRETGRTSADAAEWAWAQLDVRRSATLLALFA